MSLEFVCCVIYRITTKKQHQHPHITSETKRPIQRYCIHSNFSSTIKKHSISNFTTERTSRTFNSIITGPFSFKKKMTSLVSLACLTFGPILGAYESFKVLKSHADLASRANQDDGVVISRNNNNNRNNNRDDTPSPTSQLRVDFEINRTNTMNLLSYWVVFSLFLIFQHFIEPFIFWFPFYDYGKMCLAIFVCIPETKGAVYVFNSIVSPFLLVQESIFVEKVWPKLQKRVLGWVTGFETTVLENSVRDLSKEELLRSERDCLEILEKIEARKQHLQDNRSGDDL